MRKAVPVTMMLVLATPAVAQNYSDCVGQLPEPHNHVLKHVSSYDRTGGNADYRQVDLGQTFTVLDEPGPGVFTHS